MLLNYLWTKQLFNFSNSANNSNNGKNGNHKIPFYPADGCKGIFNCLTLLSCCTHLLENVYASVKVTQTSRHESAFSHHHAVLLGRRSRLAACAQCSVTHGFAQLRNLGGCHVCSPHFCGYFVVNVQPIHHQTRRHRRCVVLVQS